MRSKVLDRQIKAMAAHLVTGGAGFIGSHIVDLLRARVDESIVIDDLSKGLRANLPDDITLLQIDIARGIETSAQEVYELVAGTLETAPT